MSLKAKTVGALSWSLVQEISRRGLQLIIGILLARLLGPTEFGLVAMLSIFIAVSHALVVSGFGSALIQRKDPTEVDKCSVFFFNLIIGVALAALLSAAAPLIADFYHQPALTSLMRAMSLIVVINSFAVVQNAIMVRNLDFKRQAMITASSVGVSGAIGLTMAWRGFGVWSLVAQQIAYSLTRSILYWILSPWRPRAVFSFTALRQLFAFGSGMVASSILNTVFDNLYSLVIGKVFSADILGFFNRAQTFQSSASQTLGVVSNRVTFPVFSQLQDEPARLRSGLRKAMTTIAFVQFPIIIGLAAVAKPLILFLLTDKWAPSIQLLQLLCFAGLLYPVQLLNLNVLLAVGRSDLFLRLEFIKKFVILLNILVTCWLGLIPMIIGMIVTNVIAFFINSFYTKRFVGYSTFDQIRDLFPYFLISVLMGLVVFLINLPAAAGELGQLAFKVTIGAIIYWGMSQGMRLPALNELTNLIRERGRRLGTSASKS